VGMKCADPSVSAALLERETGELHPPLVAEDVRPVGADDPDELRDRLRERAEVRLALAERLLGQLAGGDVLLQRAVALFELQRLLFELADQRLAVAAEQLLFVRRRGQGRRAGGRPPRLDGAEAV